MFLCNLLERMKIFETPEKAVKPLPGYKDTFLATKTLTKFLTTVNPYYSRSALLERQKVSVPTGCIRQPVHLTFAVIGPLEAPPSSLGGFTPLKLTTFNTL